MNKMNQMNELFKVKKAEVKPRPSRKKAGKKKTVKKQEVKEQPSELVLQRNRKVARNRGESWKKSLLQASFERNLSNATRMKAVRVQKGLTQKELASKIGASSLQTFRNIEQGRKSLNESAAKKIANVLGVKLNDIFTNQNSRYFSY